MGRKTHLVGICENGSQKCACSQTFQHPKRLTTSVFWLAFSRIPTRSSANDKGSERGGKSSYCSSILESFTSPKRSLQSHVHSSSLLFLPSASHSSAPTIDVATPSACCMHTLFQGLCPGYPLYVYVSLDLTKAPCSLSPLLTVSCVHLSSYLPQDGNHKEPIFHSTLVLQHLPLLSLFL